MLVVRLNGNVNIGLVLLQSFSKHMQPKFVYCVMQKLGTPLHQAVRWGRLRVIKLLIDRGGDVNALSEVNV